MADQKINVTVGEQPLVVTIVETPLNVLVTDEPLNISAPVVLQATGGWPFGENPKRVNGIVRGSPTIVDQVAMPGQFRQVKWLLTISDPVNGLGVGNEINAFYKGGTVAFNEYAITGDADTIGYEIDFVADGDEVQMVFTSLYDGILDVGSMKIGVFA
ncbi:MAG: hypothetical protein HQL99_10920 [Magnetococcales bacterium]|nr:hypothetical protein [Magnetococcales bacterium]